VRGQVSFKFDLRGAMYCYVINPYTLDRMDCMLYTAMILVVRVGCVLGYSVAVGLRKPYVFFLVLACCVTSAFGSTYFFFCVFLCWFFVRIAGRNFLEEGKCGPIG
jgi:hypothetical protein